MTENAGNGSEDPENIGKKIVRQIEFYFGDYNLMRDTFMKEKMREDEGWFTMETMLKFKRLSTLCSEPVTILDALESSNISLIEIDMANQKIRRKPHREVPQDNEQYRTKMKARTVHVQGFQSEQNIDDINEFLETFGKIEGVQLQRDANKKFKGSLFATFFSQEDAEKFITAPMVHYKSDAITKMLRTDYYKQLDVEKKSSKKRKSNDERPKYEQHDHLKGIAIIKVSGITDDTIIHLDVKQVFESIDIQSIRFFDRLEKMGSEGFLIFQDERSPEDLLKLLEEKNGGTIIEIKSANVEFSKPNDEEKKKIEESYLEARERLFGGGRGKKTQRQNFGKHNRFQKKKREPRQHGGKKTTFDSDGEDNGNTKAETEEPSAKSAKTEE